MAGRKITENPVMTVWSALDVLAIVDIETDETQQIAVEDLLKVPWTYLQGTPSSVISVGDGIAWSGGNLNILNSTDKLDDVLRRGNVSATRGATFGSHVTIGNGGNLIVPSGVGKILFGTSVHSGSSAIFEITGDQSFAQGSGFAFRNVVNTTKYKTFYDNSNNEYVIRATDVNHNFGAVVNINTQYAQNSDLLTIQRNSSLTLSRGNPNDYESLEIRNEGQSVPKHTIRIRKQGIGVFRDFSLQYFDGTTDNIFYITASTKNTNWYHKVIFNDTIQYVNGTQGVNKVLTSDASGNATWTTIDTILPPASTDRYVSGMTFNPSTNILTLTRAGGLVDLTANLSTLAGDVGTIPTLQQVANAGRTSTIPLYSTAFYGGTTNISIAVSNIYKHVAYGGGNYSLMKFINDVTGINDAFGLDIGITDLAEGLIDLKRNAVIRVKTNGIETMIIGANNGNLIRLPQTNALSTTSFSKIAIFDSSGVIGAKTITELGLATQTYVLSVLPNDFVSKTNGGRFLDEIEAITAFKTVTSTGVPVVINEFVGGTTGRIRIQTTGNNNVVVLNGTNNQYIAGSMTLGSTTVFNTTDVYIDKPLTVGAHTSQFLGIVKMLNANAGGTVEKGLGLSNDGVVTEYDLSGIGGDNNYVTSATFSTGNGTLTLFRQGLSAVLVNLDGRYLTSFTVTHADVAQHMSSFDGKNILWNGTTFGVNIRNTTPVSILALDSNGDITSALTLGTGLSITGGALSVTSVSGTPNKLVGESSGGTLVDITLGTGLSFNGSTLNVTATAGTPTKLVGESSSGVLIDTTLGSGFSFTGSTLNYKVAGTANFIPMFNASNTYGISDSLLFTSGGETRSNGSFNVNGSMSVKNNITVKNIFFNALMGDYGPSGIQKGQLFYNGGDDNIRLELEQGSGFLISGESAVAVFEIDDNNFIYLRDVPSNSGGNSARVWKDTNGFLRLG